MHLLSPLNALLVSRFFSSLAHIVAILLLAVLFLKKPFAFGSTQIATLIGIFALADRGAAVLWSPFVAKMGARNALLLGTFICLAAMLGITLYSHFMMCAAMLLLAGFGFSLESLVSRLWISSIQLESERLSGFSWMFRLMNGGYLVGSASVFVFPIYQQGLLAFFGIALCLLLSLAIILVFFHSVEQGKPSFSDASSLSLREKILVHREHFGYVLSCLSVLMFAVYAVSQTHLLPFYYEKFDRIPAYLGWVLALNPFLILCFQGYGTKAFHWLFKKVAWQSIGIGLTLFSLSFLLFYLLTKPVNLFVFIFVLTIGEMLIAPHIDYLLSLRLPVSYRPFVFSLMSVAFGLGRLFSESGGILGMEVLFKRGWPGNDWWFVQFAVFGILALGTLFLAARCSWRMPLRSFLKGGIQHDAMGNY